MFSASEKLTPRYFNYINPFIPPKNPTTVEDGSKESLHFLRHAGRRTQESFFPENFLGSREKQQVRKNQVGAPYARTRPYKNRETIDTRRINIQHRLVYQVIEEEHVIKVIRMRSRCE